MIPIHDDNPTRRRAVLTIGLIIVNLIVLVVQLQRPADLSLSGRQALACEYGLVPDRVLDRQDPSPGPCRELNEEQPRGLALVTYQFLHGGWLHLAGNMLFLWIFANNVEDRLGRIRFLPFYLVCGVIAGLAQSLADPDSDIPLIGASGAVSGILGAYLVLFPRQRIWTIVLPLFFLPFRLPAWLWLGIYFVLQFLLLGSDMTSGGGGVAYLAHIGGFLAGLVLILPFLVGRGVPPPPSPAIARRFS